MQLAVCEFARNVCKLKNASSSEIHPDTPHPVITIIESQKDTLAEKGYGGTMRLGAYAAILKSDMIIHTIYEKSGRIDTDKERLKIFKESPDQNFRLGKLKKSHITIVERHRHRYEVNPDYIDKLTSKGLVFSGYHIRNDGTELMEFIELPNHKCFLATQAHPEFTSRLGRPNPMFLFFVKSAANGEKSG